MKRNEDLTSKIVKSFKYDNIAESDHKRIIAESTADEAAANSKRARIEETSNTQAEPYFLKTPKK